MPPRPKTRLPDDPAGDPPPPPPYPADGVSPLPTFFVPPRPPWPPFVTAAPGTPPVLPDAAPPVFPPAAVPPDPPPAPPPPGARAAPGAPPVLGVAFPPAGGVTVTASPVNAEAVAAMLR